MAKSNLKSLNFNFITQYSNTTTDSKLSYNYYSHFYLYFNHLLFGMSTFINNYSNYSVLKIKKNIFLKTYTEQSFSKSQTLSYLNHAFRSPYLETEISLFNINNQICIVHDIFHYKNERGVYKKKLKTDGITYFYITKVSNSYKYDWLKKLIIC